MSAPVTVTIANPPATKIALPAANATLKGGVWLDASATNNATGVAVPAVRRHLRLFRPGGVYGHVDVRRMALWLGHDDRSQRLVRAGLGGRQLHRNDGQRRRRHKNQ